MNLRDHKNPVFVSKEYLSFTQNDMPNIDKVVFEFAKLKTFELKKDFMSISEFEGQMISFFASLVQPRLIVEIGTLTGYSALWLARALVPGGKLTTFEKDSAHAECAKAVISKAMSMIENPDSGFYRKAIDLKVTDAISGLTQYKDQPQVVFIDANKGAYAHYTEWAKKYLAPNGLIILDNAFLRGEVLTQQENHFSKSQIESVTQSLQSLRTDPSYNCWLVPTLEGLLIAQKKSS
jgi:predicted O-methyltransferase YrrM